MASMQEMRIRLLLCRRPCAILLLIAWPVAAGFAQSPAALSGFVKDAATHEALIGANVLLAGTAQGAATSVDGYFVINGITPGRHEIIVNSIGYDKQVHAMTFAPGEKVVRDFLLEVKPIALGSVTVTAEKEAAKRDLAIAQLNLSGRTLTTLPRVVEADVFRALQFLPGVTGTSDYSTALAVRGGNTDQNLITLDGITVYNPSHLGGLFSNFITDALKDANLIKGGFPAEYGGRLSSVLRLTSREGNSRSFSGAAAISLLSSQTTLEGPLHKGAWLLALRRTYIDQLLNAARRAGLTDFELPYYFYDAQAHVFQDVSPADRISFSTYLGRDVLNWEDLTLDLNWGNRTFALNWRHLFNHQLLSNFMVAGSHFDTKVGIGGRGGAFGLNEIFDQTFKADLTYFRNAQQEIKLGLEAKNLSFEYRNVFDDRDLGSIKQEPFYLAGYVQHLWRPSLRFTLHPGLRLSYYSVATQRLRPEPRLSARLLLGEHSALSAAWGVYNQYIATVQDELNPSFIDFWFSFDRTLDPGHSVHYLAGYETEFPAAGLKLTVEGYYKTLRNLLAFRETRSSFTQEVDFTILNVFRKAEGEAYGVEVLLQKPTGRLNGWLSYALAYVFKEGQTINDQITRYPPNWDRRHSANVVLNYNFNRKWELGVLFKLGTGFPYTKASGSFEYDVLGVPRDRRVIFDTVNGARYPAYHRLDLGLTRHYFFKAWQMDLSLNLINVYNRKNVFYYVWDFDKNPAERETVPLFPFLPSVGVSAKF
ncbi:MAG: hypothetical protein DKINENOH_04126 [bacterium]|nr:hypothetical protein [bacterium]